MYEKSGQNLPLFLWKSHNTQITHIPKRRDGQNIILVGAAARYFRRN